MGSANTTKPIPEKGEFKRRLNGNNTTEAVLVWLNQFGQYSNHFYLLVNPSSRDGSRDLIIGPQWAVEESEGKVVDVYHAINLLEGLGISEVWATA